MIKKIFYNSSLPRSGSTLIQNILGQNPEFHTRNVWFTDKDENQALSLRYTGEILHDVQSPYQRVRILESYK